MKSGSKLLWPSLACLVASSIAITLLLQSKYGSDRKGVETFSPANPRTAAFGKESESSPDHKSDARKRDENLKSALETARSNYLEEKERTFAERPDLAKAYETFRFYNDWLASSQNTINDFNVWKRSNNNPETKKLLKSASQKIILSEILASVQDPQSLPWIQRMVEDPTRNSKGNNDYRRKEWEGDEPYNVDPPKEVILDLTHGNTSSFDTTLTEAETLAIPEKIRSYLRQYSQARLLKNASSIYYFSNRGKSLGDLDAKLNQAQIEYNKANANPK